MGAVVALKTGDDVYRSRVFCKCAVPRDRSACVGKGRGECRQGKKRDQDLKLNHKFWQRMWFGDGVDSEGTSTQRDSGKRLHVEECDVP